MGMLVWYENYVQSLCYLGMFMAAEFGYYWFHRFGHEINIIWGSHIAHHSSDEYNLSTALRQGAWQPLCRFFIRVALTNCFSVGCSIFLTRFSSQFHCFNFICNGILCINFGFTLE
jgi:sterol desaturase/sphingolipid hydroxylase (fatty acid hydroxylase superfamily)